MGTLVNKHKPDHTYTNISLLIMKTSAILLSVLVLCAAVQAAPVPGFGDWIKNVFSSGREFAEDSGMLEQASNAIGANRDIQVMIGQTVNSAIEENIKNEQIANSAKQLFGILMGKLNEKYGGAREETGHKN